MGGFIGIDIETTGLDPKTDQILEIGVVLFNEKLEPVASVALLGPDREGVRKTRAHDLDPYVLDMHRKSGLLEALESLPQPESGAAGNGIGSLVDTLEKWNEQIGGKQPMLGSSVHFDRAWLAHHFPEVEECFSHRNIDASSLREYAKVVDPEKYADLEASLNRKPTHRAVDDVMASAELVKVLAAETWVARTATATS